MTPARRRKLFCTFIGLLVVLAAGFAGSLLLDPSIPITQRIAALLPGRKPVSVKPGTVPVQTPLTDSTSGVEVQTQSPKAANRALHPVSSQPDIPTDKTTPLKMKFDVLGGWKYIEGKTTIPDQVRKLDGKLAEVTGFMLPINETKNITRFIVVQSLWGCCFGQTPAVNHIIVVTMEPGKTVEFCPNLVRVTGRFSVGETREQGYLVSIYRVEGNRVEAR